MKTLGIYEENVYDVYNGNTVDIKRELDLVCQLLETQTEFGDTVELFFYYAGHGYPDKKNKPYLIPIGVDAANVEDGFELSIPNENAENLISVYKSKKNPYFNMVELSKIGIKLVKKPTKTVNTAEQQNKSANKKRYKILKPFEAM